MNQIYQHRNKKKRYTNIENFKQKDKYVRKRSHIHIGNNTQSNESMLITKVKEKEKEKRKEKGIKIYQYSSINIYIQHRPHARKNEVLSCGALNKGNSVTFKPYQR